MRTNSPSQTHKSQFLPNNPYKLFQHLTTPREYCQLPAPHYPCTPSSAVYPRTCNLQLLTSGSYFKGVREPGDHTPKHQIPIYFFLFFHFSPSLIIPHLTILYPNSLLSPQSPYSRAPQILHRIFFRSQYKFPHHQPPFLPGTPPLFLPSTSLVHTAGRRILFKLT